MCGSSICTRSNSGLAPNHGDLNRRREFEASELFKWMAKTHMSEYIYIIHIIIYTITYIYIQQYIYNNIYYIILYSIILYCIVLYYNYIMDYIYIYQWINTNDEQK